MEDHDHLSSLILAHWSRYHPRMLAELRQQNLLEQTLEETADRFAEILYDLTSVRKMEYHQAWEIAVREMTPARRILELEPEEKPSRDFCSPSLTALARADCMRRPAIISRPSGCSNPSKPKTAMPRTVKRQYSPATWAGERWRRSLTDHNPMNGEARRAR